MRIGMREPSSEVIVHCCTRMQPLLRAHHQLLIKLNDVCTCTVCHVNVALCYTPLPLACSY